MKWPWQKPKVVPVRKVVVLISILSEVEIDDEALLIMFDNSDRGTSFNVPYGSLERLAHRGYLRIKVHMTDAGRERLRMLTAKVHK